LEYAQAELGCCGQQVIEDIRLNILVLGPTVVVRKYVELDGQPGGRRLEVSDKEREA
jgi:hypothetical protein